jgi:hypothetical protein
MAADCECWGLETCERCYVPPAVLPQPSTAKTLADLPIFGWAWSEDGRDRNA